MIQSDPQADDIERKLNEYIAGDELLRQLGARVLPGTVRHKEWGWTASVGTEVEPPKTLEFIFKLGEIGDRYRDEEHVDVLIAPSGVKPSEMQP